MSKTYKSILDYFGVSSQEELVRFMEENPDDPKVLELKEIMKTMGR